MSEAPKEELDYFGYKELYVSEPDVCGGEIYDNFVVITTLAALMIATAWLDAFPFYQNLGYFWSSEINLYIDRSENYLHCKVRNENELLDSLYG